MKLLSPPISTSSGGETQFFDRITNAITTGKVVDRTVGNSQVLDDVKETFFNGDPDYFKIAARDLDR